MANLVVIGDAHAKPGVSNERFTWLGKYIAATKPDVVLDIGDFEDVPSLSSYDGSTLTGGTKAKKSFEGRRYKSDVAAAIDARERIDREIRKTKRKFPRLEALGGNHCEGRVARAIDNVPELDGVISYKDFGAEDFGWNYTPYLETVNIGGFTCSHYMVSGVKGAPIGGEYPAATHLKKGLTSTITGHSHIFDTAIRTNAAGKKLFSLVSGCFLDKNQREGYAGPANHMWSKGITLLRDVENGFPRGGFEWISIERLEKEYK